MSKPDKYNKNELDLFNSEFSDLKVPISIGSSNSVVGIIGKALDVVDSIDDRHQSNKAKKIYGDYRTRMKELDNEGNRDFYEYSVKMKQLDMEQQKIDLQACMIKNNMSIEDKKKRN